MFQLISKTKFYDENDISKNIREILVKSVSLLARPTDQKDENICCKNKEILTLNYLNV